MKRIMSELSAIAPAAVGLTLLFAFVLKWSYSWIDLTLGAIFVIFAGMTTLLFLAQLSIKAMSAVWSFIRTLRIWKCE